jgi:hypothetical protein
MATSLDVRGSRLPTNLTLANAKFDEYGAIQATMQSGSPPDAGRSHTAKLGKSFGDQDENGKLHKREQ